MREWQLRAGDPIATTLACDIRLAPSDYFNDQIWELALGSGDPPALALQTTYGLRARLMRLFPRFIQGEDARTDPAEFTSPPVIRRTQPSFLELECSPFPGIDVTMETWVPQSHAIAGRITVVNNGSTDARLVMEWIGQLSPNEGQRMAVQEIQAVTVLSGRTSGLVPIIFLTGGPRPGSGAYPSLALRMELAAGDSRQVTWVHAALEDEEKSFTLARAIAAQNWEAEKARLHLVNSRQVEIFTGDPAWDAALMLSQRQAINLLVGPTEHLPHPSLVWVRQPDQGFSLRGDGSDYNHLWNGQSPLETLYLAGLLLPSAPELAAGLARNYFQAQSDNGEIDWKPGLAGQRSKLLAAPLLANLVWRVYESTADVSLLEAACDPLLHFIRTWFNSEHDRDNDGVPEWDHPMQAGSEDHPLYSRWQAWSRGVDIITAESPALSAMLYRECRSLVKILRALDRQEAVPELEAAAERLSQAVEAAWDDEAPGYFDWDRDTHYSTRGELLLDTKGAGLRQLQRNFDHPVRLLINIHTDETVRRRPTLFIHGRSASGHPRIERITDEQFRWTPGLGRVTGRYVYAQIERIEIHGLESEDQLCIESAGYNLQEISNLLPLWAGIPAPERAKRLVEETITQSSVFWRSFGLPTCPHPMEDPAAEVCAGTNLIWNSLVGEGLLYYGFRAQAAEMVVRLLSVVVQSLRLERAFRRYYHADTGKGIGERNALSGLFPVNLFLETLGVHIISPTRVALNGFNPFPRPVTVKYRGLTVLSQKEKTTVIFPDGQMVAVDDPAPRVISLE